jgi:hypothetical protein
MAEIGHFDGRRLRSIASKAGDQMLQFSRTIE